MRDYYQLARTFLEDLVGFDTTNPPGNELPLAKHVAEVMESYGFKILVTDIGNNRGNAVIEYGDSDNLLMFNGHLDVVPPGEGWSTDPFKLTEADGRLYGRGACDMKVGTACFMAAAIKAKDEGRIKDCMLRMVLVCDEEVDGLGAQAFAKEYKPARKTLTVIGEPTEFQTIIAHRGVTRFKITVNGRQCHSGVPQQGINAISMMAKVIDKIVEFDKSRQNVRVGILPPPNMTPTMINAGVKENVVPGVCELIVDCRTVPGDTPETLGKALEDILSGLFAGTEVKYSVECFISVPPSSNDAGSRGVGIMGRAIKAVTGKEQVVNYFNGCCDMPYFIDGGFTDVFLCGPGSLDQAHVPNEYVEAHYIPLGVDIYGKLIDEVQLD